MRRWSGSTGETRLSPNSIRSVCVPEIDSILLRRMKSVGHDSRMSSSEQIKTPAKSLDATIEEVDRLYRPYIKSSEADPYHTLLPEFYGKCGEVRDCSVLEIGSRAVSGITRRHLFPKARRYVGFDIHEGPGVDVVGDAHELSKYFAEATFDAVYSMSVFEHLAFPWKVVLETNKVLKRGGLCYVSTHTVWPPHELPWDFWRFPLAGLKLLFSEPFGFKIVSAQEGLPSRVHSLSIDPPTRGLSGYESPLAVAIVAEKVGDYNRDKLRWDVPLSSVLTSIYPNRTR